MKHLAAPFQQLVERRLWPLAVLLLAAAAAVPFLLAEAPAPPATQALAAAVPGQGDTTPIVSRADDAEIETERRVLGAPKDPFRPAIAAKPARTAEPDRVLDRAGTAQTPAAKTPTATSVPSSGGGPATGGGGTTPTAAPPTPATTPSATPTPAPKPTYPRYSLVARFGAVGEPKVRRLVLRSTGLPSNAHIGLIYKGVLKDRRTAVFWVVRGTEVEGDGTCQPGPENCQYVRLQVGETLFFTLPGGDQYQLDLVKVHAGRAADEAARGQERGELPRRVRGGAGRYRYDRRTGLLGEVSRRELRASAAQASAGVPVG